MEIDPKCPRCESANTYADGAIWVCPECDFEWNPSLTTPSAAKSADDEETVHVVTDANGTILQDGDAVTVIKELRVKGSSAVVKVGTKVKNIRLVDGVDGHDIACKIDGFGSMNLKSEFVRKV